MALPKLEKYSDYSILASAILTDYTEVTVPEITPTIIALREAVKAYEAVRVPSGRDEPSYDDENCRAARQLYMAATGQADQAVASREIKAKLAELRAARASAQLYHDIEHAMNHTFSPHTYDKLNEQGNKELEEAHRQASIAYQAVLDSLAMGGFGSHSTLSELSNIHCRVCQSLGRARLQSA